MRNPIFTAAFLVAGASLALAQGGGMGGGMMGGSGMLVIADDNSVLVTEMGIDGGMMGGGEFQRELINIGADGEERWRVSFDEGWPMMPTTEGDLVVLTLADDWWMGDGGMGDGGWGGPTKVQDGDHEGQAVLIALSLSTGEELWRLEIDGMMAMPQFTEDGSRLYLTIRDMDGDGPMGSDPMHQGDAAGSDMLMTSTLMAVDRDGNVLWTLDLDGGMMGPIANGGV